MITLMKNKQIIVGGIAVLLVLLFLMAIFIGGKGSGTHTPTEVTTDTQVVSDSDPIDIVLDFYGPWLDAAQSTSTDFQQLGLADNPLLSEELRTKLTEASVIDELDPVICQDPLPEKIQSKKIYDEGDKSQILVFSKEQNRAGQAVVTLLRQNDGWYIDDIVCSRGEFDVPREFTFMYEGNLLKSVPPPYDPEFWHLVYAQNGTFGYVVPLYFSDASICTDMSGAESVCAPDKFMETRKVMVRGEMTESGVEVKQLDFIE